MVLTIDFNLFAETLFVFPMSSKILLSCFLNDRIRFMRYNSTYYVCCQYDWPKSKKKTIIKERIELS